MEAILNEETIMEIEENIDEIREDVRGRYPDIPWVNVYKSPLWYGSGDTGSHRIPDSFAVLGYNEERDGDDEHVFAKAVSDQYQIVDHEYAVYKLEEMIKSGDLDEYGKPEMKINLFSFGAKLSVNISFPDVTMEVKPGSKVNPVLKAWNSHDTNWRFALEQWANEKVCSNGMIAPRRQRRFSGKHRLSLSVSDLVTNAKQQMIDFSETIGIWRDWVGKTLSIEQMEDVWEELPFGTRHQEKIKALPLIGSNETYQQWEEKGKIDVWDLHFLLTQFTTHEIESEIRKIQLTENIERVFQKSKIIQKVVKK